MTVSFGTRLRQQREQREVALAAIAADTKIKLSLLEALERDDLSHWPQGIFRRAYMRSYAQAIGLDPSAVVREFLELYPDPAEVSAADPAASPDGSAESASAPSPNRLRRLVTSAIAAVPALQPSQRRDAAVTAPPVARASPVQDAPVAAERASSASRDDLVDADIPASEPGPSSAGLHGPDEDEPVSTVPVAVAEAEESHVEGRPALSLSAAADLCTRLGRIQDRRELAHVLEDAARILDAVGLLVWSWDPRPSTLTPSLAHGYSDSVLARLPTVPCDADNAIAAAFRSAQSCVVDGDRDLTGAVVIPLMAPSGCTGVLALELRHGGERREPVRAFATILAAQLVTLIGSPTRADAVSA